MKNLKSKVCTELADYFSTKKILSVQRWICGEDSAGIRNVCNQFWNNQDMHVMLLLKKAHANSSGIVALPYRVHENRHYHYSYPIEHQDFTQIGNGRQFTTAADSKQPCWGINVRLYSSSARWEVGQIQKVNTVLAQQGMYVWQETTRGVNHRWQLVSFN